MPMCRFLKELYLTGFTLGFRVSGSSWWPSMNAGKGVASVGVIEGFILMSIEMWIEMYSGTRFLLSAGKLGIGVAFLALYYANYYILVTRGIGIKFEHEFDNLEMTRKFRLIAGFVVAVLATTVLFAWSVSVYHHFFHIIPT